MPSAGAGPGVVDYSALVASGPASSSAVEDDFASYYAKQAALSRLLLGSHTSSGGEAAPLAGQEVQATTKANEGSTEEKADGKEAEVADEDEEGEEDEGAEGAAGGWQRFKDESTGAFYYFNCTTGESSWQDPAANAAASSADTLETTEKAAVET